MAAAPASAAHAPHAPLPVREVPTTAVQHLVPVGLLSPDLSGAMVSRGHHAGTMMIGHRAVRPAIALIGPVQPAAMNARAAMTVDVTSGHRAVDAPVTGLHSGTTVVGMIGRQVAGQLAAMMIGPPTVIPRQVGAVRAVRVMNGRTTQANQGALRKEATIASARHSGQGQARAPGPVRRVAAIATSGPSACAPGRSVTTPATDRVREAADRPRANRNSFPDRSG